MIRYSPLLFVAVLCAALASSCGSQHHGDRPLTIYDTAVLMLKEFVHEGPDTNLGIKNFDELDDLVLRRDYGVEVYLLLEDSLMADDSVIHIDHHMLKMGRRIYPVYYRNQLRSTITFDSTPKGWHPSVFDDSNVYVEIQEAEAQLRSTVAAADASSAESAHSAKDSTAHAVMIAPSLHDYVAFRQTEKGDYFLPTKDLKREMAENYPGTEKDGKLAPIEKADFFRGLRKHILAKRSRHKRMATMGRS